MNVQCPNCFENYDSDLGICPRCGFTEGEHAKEALHMDPGTVLLNRYRIGAVLGFGGFGVTYLAWDMVLEMKVAIKEYLPSEFSTRSVGVSQVTVFSGNKEQQFKDGMEKFVAEAKRLARFQGEAGIVQIFDSFMANNTAYIVMEYLEGETLTSFLEREGTVSADAAIGLLTPVIKSLETVHAEGIIHRDIAPDNIMITTDGEVKLIDFGAARYATTSHSRSLTVIIKPGYSPEEQYRSRGDQGPHTDVYSAASVLYRMITGVTPPDAMERRAFFENGKKDMLEAPSKYVKDLNTNVETAILNAMNVRIEDRTPDMGTFFEELTSDKPVKRRVGKIKKTDVLKWPLWAKIAVPTGLIAVITLLVLFFTGVIKFDAGLKTIIEIPDGMTRVPSVVNDSVDNAETKLETAELLYVIENYETDSLVPANMILHQEYNAGSVVAVNSLMGLTISKGADLSTVPNITGFDQEDAISYLEAQGFTVVVEEIYSNVIAQGSVISQSVNGGEELESGSMIIITVSKGVDPEMVKEETMITVPDFSGMTYEEAIEAAEEVGLVISVTSREYSSEYAENEIMSQSIQAGEEIYSGNIIYFTVSKGEQIYNVPDVIGEQYEDAIKILEEQGYVVEINEVENNTYAAGLVFVQSPNAGSELAVGETVVLTVSKGSASFIVADVVGLAEEDAENTLKAQGLTVTTAYEKTSRENVGLVISQTPEGGTQGNRGDEVIITVGTDKDINSVPDVTGKIRSDAEQILKDSGFSVSVSESSSDTVEKGKVISQTPVAGSNQIKGSVIVIVVSTGPNSVSVSSVVGKTEKIATNILEGQGFNVNVTYEYSDEVVSGAVISQSPADGELVYKGDTVTISVSKGSEPISIPNVEGKTQSEATETLTSAGFKVSVTESYSDTVASGKVVSQNPASSSTGYKGDTVQLTVSLGKAEVAVTGLTLNKTSLTLTEGDSAQLTCTVAPSNASDTDVSYSSSDTSVVTVGSNGLVTAKASGKATITVTSNSGGVKATCAVTVEEAYVTKISISSQPTKTSYYVGDSLDDSGCRLQVTYNNGKTEYISSGYKNTYDFSTSGTKTVKVTYEDCETSYTVTVKTPSVTLSATSLTLFEGDTYTLSATVLPSGSEISWSSSNTSVVGISDGKLSAKTKGTATITAEITYNGTKYQSTCSVTVSSTGVVLDSASAQLYIGDTKTITATTNPSGQSVSWSSSASSVATVSSDGKVTAVSAGSATITASFTYSGTTYNATCAVTVISPSLSLDEDSVDIYVGDTVALNAVSLPSGTSVTWSSSNTSVATVSGGTVTALAAGSTTITASMSYGGKTYTANCSVTVTKPSISLSSSSLSLYVGDTSTLTATVVPSGSTVTWSSSSTSAATVTSAGKITAKAAGSTTITAKITYQGTTYSATCSVTVTKPSVSLNSSSLSLYVGDTSTITATVVPSGSTVTWTSSSTSVATVSSGTVTAKGAGTATITAKITYQGTTYSATCSVTVTKPSISISSSSLSLYVGDTSTLTATVVPSGSTVTWSSSKTSVATVSSGTVTAKAAGTATITAKITYQGTTYSATCSVTVTKPSVSLSSSSLSLYVGDTSTLTATVVPSGSTVTWSSSSTSIATVTSAGKVTAEAAGSATITAKITYQGTTYSATCSVTVTKPSVTLSSSSLSLYLGDTSTLTATVVPSGSSVTWSSSSTSIATVTSAGKVTAKAAGSATITAKITYQGTTYSATCSVTVTKPSISLSKSSLSINVGGTSTLTATVVPSGSTVTWSSSSTSIATVSSAGKVTGVSAGSATITASITYNGTTYKATCSVTVSKVLVSSISRSTSSTTLTIKDTGVSFNSISSSLTVYSGSVSWSINHSYSLPTYTLTFTTNSATDPSLTIKSSDTSVVTVSSTSRSGNTTTVVIKAVHNSSAYNSTRSATITATANDGSGVSTSVTVKVAEPWSYTFTSSNSDVLYISSDGNTSYGKQAGSVTVKVTTVAGNTASATVTVNELSSWAGHTWRVRSNLASLNGASALIVRASPSTSASQVTSINYSSGNFYVSKTYYDGTRIWGYTSTYGGWVSLWNVNEESTNAYIVS